MTFGNPLTWAKIKPEKMINKKIQGKKNRESGRRFELKVRKDLEDKGWIVSKWMNNISELKQDKPSSETNGYRKLIPAKHKFRGKGIPMAIGTGFPDFICFKIVKIKTPVGEIRPTPDVYEIIGVEVKSNGYLDREEKLKCKWLLDNNIFSKILIASKGKKRGEIIYEEFKWKAT